MKSKEEKAIEEKILVGRAIGAIKKYIADLDKSKSMYAKEAKSAKLNGHTAQYNMARNAIKMVYSHSITAQSMLLNLEISGQMKDTAAVTEQFTRGISLLCGDITNINSRLNFTKARKKMTSAIAGMESLDMKSQAMLDMMGGAFENLSGSEVADSAIDSLIDNEILTEELDSQSDSAIDRLIKRQ